MKTEKQIRAELNRLRKIDEACPRCRIGKLCLDFGHGIKGTQQGILAWVLSDNNTTLATAGGKE